MERIRRNVMLVSGRYAMLDDGMGFQPAAVEAGAGAAPRPTACRDGSGWRGASGGNVSSIGEFLAFLPVVPQIK